MNPSRQPDLLRQPLQIQLSETRPPTVASPVVAEEDDAGGAGMESLCEVQPACTQGTRGELRFVAADAQSDKVHVERDVVDSAGQTKPWPVILWGSPSCGTRFPPAGRCDNRLYPHVDGQDRFLCLLRLLPAFSGFRISTMILIYSFRSGCGRRLEGASSFVAVCIQGWGPLEALSVRTFWIDRASRSV